MPQMLFIPSLGHPLLALTVTPGEKDRQGTGLALGPGRDQHCHQHQGLHYKKQKQNEKSGRGEQHPHMSYTKASQCFTLSLFITTSLQSL